MAIYLDFEKDLAEIQSKISDLESLPDSSDSKNIKNEIELLKTKSADVLKDLYGEMNPWRKCQVARHPERPHTKDYIDYMISEYTPLSGDRNFAEDLAIVGGLGRLQDTPVVVLGHEKGNTTESRFREILEWQGLKDIEKLLVL